MDQSRFKLVGAAGVALVVIVAIQPFNRAIGATTSPMFTRPPTQSVSGTAFAGPDGLVGAICGFVAPLDVLGLFGTICQVGPVAGVVVKDGSTDIATTGSDGTYAYSYTSPTLRLSATLTRAPVSIFGSQPTVVTCRYGSATGPTTKEIPFSGADGPVDWYC